MKRILGIDLETFSKLDIKKVGAHKYAQNCEILLFGYAYDDDPVTVLDLTSGDVIPDSIINDVLGDEVTKYAYNAQFERSVLSNIFNGGRYLSAKSWHCTMVESMYLGFPGGLGELTKILYPGQIDKQKNAEGKALIKFFSTPCKPTFSNNFSTRNIPEDYPEKWQRYVEYNRQDVVVERNVRKVISKIPMPDQEHEYYIMDQVINDRGVRADRTLIDSAIDLDNIQTSKYLDRLYEITQLQNPKSNPQFLKWIQEQGIDVSSTNKETLANVSTMDIPAHVEDAIKLKQLLSKTSIKKYYAMDCTMCNDGRIHGLIQFYGANRTGRFAGRLVQVQNLARNNIRGISTCREMLVHREYEAMKALWGDLPYTLSQLIRTAFAPRKGYEYIISDFHAIEAVLAAWLTGEEWRLEVFKGDGMIYEASAAQMFHVEKDSIKTADGQEGPNYSLRQKGKVAELALGYGGGVGALTVMGALDMGIAEEELPEIVSKWREASPTLCKFWKTLENAAKKAIRTREPQKLQRDIVIYYQWGIMFIRLPSGRTIAYVRPKLEEIETRYGTKMEITYEGMDQETKKWVRIKTWGGKLFENVIQAIARDILCHAMYNLEKKGFPIVMHVHDEVICETPIGRYSVEDLNAIMEDMPDWGKDIPLEAAGFKNNFYKKD